MKSNLLKVAFSSTLLFTQTLFAFNELTDSEYPTRVYSVSFTTKSATDPRKIRELSEKKLISPSPFSMITAIEEISQDTRDIEIKFAPGALIPSLSIPQGFPLDAESHVHTLLGLREKPETAPEGFGYMYENMYAAPNPSNVIGKREYWMQATPTQFIEKLKYHMSEAQKAGLKAVSLKNPEIIETINIILNGNHKKRGKLSQDKVKEVLSVLSYVFSGKVTESPLGLKDSILTADITLAPGSKRPVKAKNALLVRELLKSSGLTLSEDKTYLIRTLPKNNG